MTDIFDIKLLIFWTLFSLKYILFWGIILFLVIYYFLLQYYLVKKTTSSVVVEAIPVENTFDIEKKLHYLSLYVESFETWFFYAELSRILREYVFHLYQDEKIFVCTAQELKENYSHPFQEIFEQVYLYEFDPSQADSFEQRKDIIQKILNIYKDSFFQK